MIAVVFFFLLLIIVKPIQSIEPTSRQIIVFNKETSDQVKLGFAERYNLRIEKNLKLVNAISVNLPPRLTEAIKRYPGVLRIDPDVEVFINQPTKVYTQGICDMFPWLSWCRTPTPTSTPKPTATPTPKPTATPTPISDPLPTNTPTPVSENQSIPWNIAGVGADNAWSLSAGKGVKVAIIDTGIDRDHPDLSANLAGCVNLITSRRTCEDDNGHGTHVAGIVASINNNFGVVGVAPEARIYALKALNSRGSGYLSDIIEALEWSINNQVEVVNLSLGTSSNVTSLYEAIKKTYDAGIVIVASAGNSGPNSNTVTYPARYPEVIAVASVNQENQVSSWSSRGPEIDIAAYGEGIYSTYPNNSYNTMSGTSMAAPHVTGAVALRFFLYPGESNSQIFKVITENTNSLPLPAEAVGSGLLNAYQVVSAPSQ